MTVSAQEPTGVDERIVRLASKRGVFTRSQALACGASAAVISRRVRARRWEVLYPSVYGVTGTPVTWERDALAACLYFGLGSAVSFRSAAALRGFPGFQRRIIEILVPRDRNRSRPVGVTVRTSSYLPRGDITTVEGIPATKPARTLLDLAIVEAPDVIERCLDDALRRRLLTLATLGRWLRDPRRARHRGIPVLRAMAGARASIGATESPLETELLRLIRRSRLPVPVVQHEIPDGDGFVARVDSRIRTGEWPSRWMVSGSTAGIE